MGIVTLVVRGVAALPGALQRFGPRWHYVATACYTLTLFFHMAPGQGDGACAFPRSCERLAQWRGTVFAR